MKTKIKFEQLEIGQHLWGIQNGQLLVLMKDETGRGYEVCGAWECGASKESVEIIELIGRPPNHSRTQLCYCELKKQELNKD
jgi:hypothetical protein